MLKIFLLPLYGVYMSFKRIPAFLRATMASYGVRVGLQKPSPQSMDSLGQAIWTQASTWSIISSFQGITSDSSTCINTWSEDQRTRARKETLLWVCHDQNPHRTMIIIELPHSNSRDSPEKSYRIFEGIVDYKWEHHLGETYVKISHAGAWSGLSDACWDGHEKRVLQDLHPDISTVRTLSNAKFTPCNVIAVSLKLVCSFPIVTHEYLISTELNNLECSRPGWYLYN